MLLVLLLCLVWGFQQVAMKGVAAETPPVMQLTVRFAIAAVFFGTWVLVSEGRRAFADGSLPSGLLLGFLFSLEFLLVGLAIARTSASHTTVFLYTAPIFTAIGLQYHPEERLNGVQWVGIAVAFAGIAWAFLGGGDPAAFAGLDGDLLALLAGAAWGLSNVVLRRGRVSHAATAKTVLYQVGTAALLVGLFALARGEARVTFSTLSVLSLLFQTLIIAVGSYLIWFWLLRNYQTSRLMLLSFLTPLFGVLFGAALLKDRLDPHFTLGASLVLGGVLIVNLRLTRR